MKLRSIANTVANAFSTRNVGRAATTVKHAVEDGLSNLRRQTRTPSPTASSLPPRRSIPGTFQAARQRDIPQAVASHGSSVNTSLRQQSISRESIPVPKNAMEEDEQLRAALEASLVDVAIQASLNQPQRQQLAQREPIPVPNDATEEDEQLRAALEASLVDVAIRNSLNQPQPDAAGSSNRHGRQPQFVRQDSIPVPKDAMEEDQQLRAALEASLVDVAIQNSLNQPQPHAAGGSNRHGQRPQPVRRDPIRAPQDAMEEDQQLRAALEASLIDVAIRNSLNQPQSQTAGGSNWYGQRPQFVRQDSIPVPRNAMEEDQQLHAALQASLVDVENQELEAAVNASLADTPGASPIPPNWRESPMYRDLNIGNVPDDGNCFFHSVIQLAGSRIAQELGIAPDALQPKDIRQHIASTTIDQLIECEKGGPAAEALMERYPHLQHMQVHEPESGILLDLANGPQALAFWEVLGRDAERCQHMTPTTLTNLYHLACDKSWNSSSGDFFAPATAAAFPGLRIAVVAPHARLTFGEGEEAPHLLVLQGAHFMPATERS